jgi:uncharacterized protein YciI
MPFMQEWLYFLIPPRPTFAHDASEFEASKMGEHVQYLRRLLEEGTLVLAGRTQDQPPTGIAVFRAVDETAARAIMDGDPAVAAGVVRGDLHPYAIALIESTAARV